MISLPQHIRLLPNGSIIRAKEYDNENLFFNLQMNVEGNNVFIDYYCPDAELSLSDTIMDEMILSEQKVLFTELIMKVSLTNDAVFYIKI